MKTQKQIEEIKDFSPRDIAIQVMKAIEVADITQWNGKNVFEESEYEAIFQSIEDGVSLAVEQREKEVLDMVVKEIDEIPFSKEIQDIYESKNNEYVKRSLSGLLQVKSPIDTNKGYEFVYVTKKVEEFIVELVNSLLIQDRKDITDSLKQKLLSTNKE